jgi:hypothetical protein
MPKVRANKKQKTRPQLARMVARRLRMTSTVRVVSIQSNPDGTWHPITIGSRAAIENAQPRIDAIMAKLRGSYELIDVPSAGESRWLAWLRREKFKRLKK